MRFRRLVRSRSDQTPLPDGVRIYAIGDIHGCSDLLAQLLLRIDRHLSSNPVHDAIQVFLGDYIDRGPNSREVINQLIERALNHNAVFLKGNHEAWLLEFLKDPRSLESWGEYGGLQTLLSYGLSPSISRTFADSKVLASELNAALPESHRRFLNGLKPTFVCGNYFFVHAGVRPKIALSKQKENDLLWIRDEFLSYEKDFGKIIVHGHTPVIEPDVRPNRINIDTGAYATGRLTCAVLENSTVAFL
jgi:serine/threonine protein phosphatase 1